MLRASRLLKMLCFIPQSTAMTRFGPLSYRTGFLIETCATRLSLSGSWNSISSVWSSWTILPSIVPRVRSFCVRALVSMPVIAGILCFLSQSERDFFASQWE